MLKIRKGRPRMKNPSHHYTVKQWEQHRNQPDKLGVLRVLKKMGLGSLFGYSFPDLLKSVHGKKPKCFAIGKIDTLPGCQKCIENDSISGAEGFFDLEGKEIGSDCYGIYSCCWISNWIREISQREIERGN